MGYESPVEVNMHGRLKVAPIYFVLLSYNGCARWSKCGYGLVIRGLVSDRLRVSNDVCERLVFYFYLSICYYA